MATEKRVTEKTEIETETKNRWTRPSTDEEGESKKSVTKVERTEETDDKPTIVIQNEE